MKDIFYTIKNISDFYKKNKKNIFIKKTKTIYLLLFFLHNQGFIDSYYESGELLCINLKYNNTPDRIIFKPPYKKFIFKSKPNKNLYFSCRDLQKILTFNKVFVISTSSGFLTGEDAVKRKIGGIYIGYFII